MNDLSIEGLSRERVNSDDSFLSERDFAILVFRDIYSNGQLVEICHGHSDRARLDKFARLHIASKDGAIHRGVDHEFGYLSIYQPKAGLRLPNRSFGLIDSRLSLL